MTCTAHILWKCAIVQYIVSDASFFEDSVNDAAKYNTQMITCIPMISQCTRVQKQNHSNTHTNIQAHQYKGIKIEINISQCTELPTSGYHSVCVCARACMHACVAP